MTRHQSTAASAPVALAVLAAFAVLAVASPATAQSGSGGRGTTTTTPGGRTRGTAPSRSALPNSALTTSSVASPFAWLDDGRILPTSTVSVAVSSVHWQGTDVSEVDAPVTSI